MKRLILSLGLILWMLDGCSKNVQIATLQPAHADQAAKVHRIAVYNIKGDTIGLRAKLESSLASVVVEGEPWFTIVDRDHLFALLQEIRLQNSALSDVDLIVEAGRLVGAEAIVTGDIIYAEVTDDYYTRTRTRCVDEKCTQRQKYKIYCKNRHAALGAQLHIVDIESSRILYVETFDEETDEHHCRDTRGGLPAKKEMLSTLADKIALRFTERLTPHYRTLRITLLEAPKIKMSSSQQELLDKGIRALENGYYHIAENLLSRLFKSTYQKSPVVAYDLGVAKEALNKLEEARALYRLALELDTNPDESIMEANARIDRAIEAKRQISERMERD